jgi:hypothetical protein
MDWGVGGGAWQKRGRGSASAKMLRENNRPMDKRRAPESGYAERIAETVMVEAAGSKKSRK